MPRPVQYTVYHLSELTPAARSFAQAWLTRNFVPADRHKSMEFHHTGLPYFGESEEKEAARPREDGEEKGTCPTCGNSYDRPIEL